MRSWTKVRTTLCLARDKLNVGETNLFYHVLYCCAKNTPAHGAKKLPPFFAPPIQQLKVTAKLSFVTNASPTTILSAIHSSRRRILCRVVTHKTPSFSSMSTQSHLSGARLGSSMFMKGGVCLRRAFYYRGKLRMPKNFGCQLRFFFTQQQKRKLGTSGGRRNFQFVADSKQSKSGDLRNTRSNATNGVRGKASSSSAIQKRLLRVPLPLPPPLRPL